MESGGSGMTQQGELAATLPTRRQDALTLAEITWRVTDCEHPKGTAPCGHRRAVHDALRDLARSGMVPLIADSSVGYWLGTVEEVAAYLERQEGRIAEMSKRLAGLRRWRDAMTLHESEQLLFHLGEAA